MDTPLAGLNIVVTRPREQAEELAHRIARAGGKTFLFPLLEIGPTTDPQSLHALVERLHEFDLAIFISHNAVRYGMEAIRARHVGLKPDLQIAAVGQGSAKALHSFKVHEVIAPQDKSDSEALLALPEIQNVEGKRIVIFRGDGGRELLGDTLKARGAMVEYAECYRRIKPQLDIALLRISAPDVITITSSEALAHLWGALDEQGRKWLAAIPLFVPHARIAEAARGLGWNNVITTSGGDDGLLEGLVAWVIMKQEAGNGITEL
jgi:uroporphyrinogen-III synthase